MLYIDIKLPLKGLLPNYQIHTNGDSRYCYTRIYSKGRCAPREVCVGKIISEDGEDILIPNDSYFKQISKTKPDPDSQVVGPGRKTSCYGVINAFDTIVKNNSKITVGYTLACKKLADDSHLWSTLCDAFGDKTTQEIFGVGSFMALGVPGGMASLEEFSRKNIVLTGGIITSQYLSHLYEDITSQSVDEFFTNWTKTQMGSPVCYDVTSVASYSSKNPMTGWGYHRSDADLPQINLSMLCSVNNEMPLMFEVYDGSVNDFTNFPSFLKHAMRLGIPKPKTIILDGGFAVTSVVEALSKSGITFILGASSSKFSSVRQALQDWFVTNPTLNGPHFLFEGATGNDEVFYYHETSVQFGDCECRLFLYLSTNKLDNVSVGFLKKLESIKSTIENQNAVPKFSDREASNIMDCLYITQSNERLHVEVDDRKLNDLVLLNGCTALFCSNKDISPKEALRQYRAKNTVEKTFDVLKNDVLHKFFRVQEKGLYGKAFISFIGCILRVLFNQRLQPILEKAPLKTVDSCLAQLQNIYCVRYQNDYILTKALTKDQKDIIKTLGLKCNDPKHNV